MLLAAPEQADINAVRDGVLFNYNMFAYLDGDFLQQGRRRTCSKAASRTEAQEAPASCRT